jgi:similar to stage IV sporulation protein
VNVEVEGYYIEKFLNKCINNGILVWGVKHKKTTLIEAKVGVSDYKKIKNTASYNGCIVTKIKEKGIPIIIKKYKKRQGLLIGIILVVTIIFALSKFVWKIDIIGNENIRKDEILNLIEKDGLKTGTLKSKINVKKIINKIRMERDDISWIGIELKGTKAIVKIVEATKKPDIVDDRYFCNIIASKDAVITRIVVQNGTAQVKNGDSVKKGDILIAGWIQGEHTDKYFVNSAGEVKGKIQYVQTEKINKKEIKTTRTGKKEKKYSIKINNFVINFYKTYSKFKKYDTIETEKNLKLFKNLYLPIQVKEICNYEENEVEVHNDYETAKILGETTAKQKLDSLLGFSKSAQLKESNQGEKEKENCEELVDSNTEVTEKDDHYEVKVTYQVIEDIGTKEKI